MSDSERDNQELESPCEQFCEESGEDESLVSFSSKNSLNDNSEINNEENDDQDNDISNESSEPATIDMTEVFELKSRIDTLELQFGCFHKKIDKELEEMKKQIAEIKETLRPKIITVTKPSTPDYDLKVVKELDEDLDKELDKQETPPARRPAPRVSISNWSEQRKKNNMSVKSVVSSLERRRA